MNDADLIARLEAIERRLAALERSAPKVDVAPTVVPAHAPARSASGPVAVPPPPPNCPASGASRAVPAAPPSFPHAPRAPEPVKVLVEPHASASTAAPAGLERFLGGQVAAWIGGIVVIAAIGIFAKFAIDQGWFERTPPAAKLALAYALAGAFVIAGSLLQGKLGRLPAGAMLAGGIGGLFVSTCAGITPLNVLGPASALVAGLVVAAIGGALTLRSRELAVAAIALLGAYIVPAFAGTYVLVGQPSGELPITGALYLTGVYALALALAQFGPPSFAWLRFAGALQAISAALLIFDSSRSSPALSLGFTSLWWGMTAAECSLAAVRGRSPRLNVAFTVAATSITATLALRGAVATDPWTDVHSWLPAGMAALAVLGAMQLRSLVPSGGLDRRDTEDDPHAAQIAAATARQSLTLAILSIALVTVQVGVVMRGGALAIAWAAMGAAAILVGRRMAQPWTARVGFSTAMLSVIALFVVLPGMGTATTVIEYPSDPSLARDSAWAFRMTEAHWPPLMVAVLLALAARASSIGSDPTRRAPISSGVLAACAMLLWITLSFSVASAYATVTMLLAIPCAALGGGRTVSLIKLLALLGSIIASLGWFAATMSRVAMQYGTDSVRPEGGAIAAALVVGGYLLLGQRFRGERFRDVATAIGFGFGLAALTTLLLIEQLAGPNAGDVMRATIWSCAAIAVVATIGAFSANRAGLEHSQGLGLVATALAAGVALFAITAETLQPPSGATWLNHCLIAPANAALVVFALCGLSLRTVCHASASARKSFGAMAAVTCLVGSSALVLRLFDPRVDPPFATTAVIQQSALSVWLAIAAVLFVVHGFRCQERQMRWTGLVLLGAVAIKVLLLDMASAGTIWRVIALLAIGLLLVATSAVYSRAARAHVPVTPPPPPR